MIRSGVVPDPDGILPAESTSQGGAPLAHPQGRGRFVHVQRRFMITLAIAAVLIAPIIALVTSPTQAVEPGLPEFQEAWERTDLPVRNLDVNRTWVWGPEANTPVLTEPYAEGPNGERHVQYFDKARMEISTEDDLDEDSPWVVTNGLLPIELMTGELQLGDDTFEQHEPAEIYIAGDPIEDPDTPNAPTYAEVAHLMDEPATDEGETITATIDADGQVGDDPAYAEFNVTADYYVEATDHTVASVFWDLMNSDATISLDGQNQQGPLFPDPFFAFGYPVTEAYWTTVNVAGEPTTVLVQIFERRVATYTPDNPDGWKVETGNVGQHYYIWRYETIGTTPPMVAPPPSPPTPTPTPTEPVDLENLPYGLGQIGTPGEALGPNEILEEIQPYADVPLGSPDVMPEPVVRTGITGTINMQVSINMVLNIDPASHGQQIYWVIDWNDGSATVTGLWDAHDGDFVSHTWSERGTFQIKVWAIDPALDVRSPIIERTVVID